MLLSSDTKLYAKIFAKRLKEQMPEGIHTDQTGFIPGKEGEDNEIRTLLMLHKVRGGKFPALFLSIDAKKAFDRADWAFMMETVEALGVGSKMSM